MMGHFLWWDWRVGTIGPIGRVTLPLKGWERIGTLAWWDMNKGNYPS